MQTALARIIGGPLDGAEVTVQMQPMGGTAAAVPPDLLLRRREDRPGVEHRYVCIAERGPAPRYLYDVTLTRSHSGE